MSNVLVVGDVHGCFENLNIILKAYKNLDAVIVCGDYGIWNDFSPQNIPETYNIDYPFISLMEITRTTRHSILMNVEKSTKLLETCISVHMGLYLISIM